MSQPDDAGAAMSGGADWAAAALAPSVERGIEEEINPSLRQLLDRRPPRVVCIGGGTGLPTVLRGLARRRLADLRSPAPHITAIVAMSDDGGSSGRLRRSRGSLPPGDVRKCLVALASGNSELSRVFRYRFGGKAGLAGHAVGNLLITAMAELKGDFLEAIKSSADLLRARGTVLPCTLSPVELVAYKAGDACVAGERNLSRVPGRVVRIALRPKAPPAVDAALEAIESADLISIGPGSLYSSILPNLLVDGVARALRRTRALKVLISNLMTQPGETDGMDCADHLRAVLDHAGPVVDIVLVNGTPFDPKIVQRYALRGSEPVRFDRAAVLGTGVIPLETDLLKDGPRIRHDGRKLARRLVRISRCGP